MPYSFTMHCVEGWCDVTDDVDGDNTPLTFARPDGVGALQLSAAVYRSGPVPAPSAAVLLSMVHELADAHDLVAPFDIITEDSELRLAGTSFQWQDNFLRVWFLSDGSNFAQVTYTCTWGEVREELVDCERMVRTIRFSDATQAG